MRLLFFEPNFTGHHLPYLARMLPGFLNLNIRVALSTTQQALDSVEFSKTLKWAEDELECLPLCKPLSQKLIANARQRYSQLTHSVKSWEPDHIAVLYGDGLWQFWAMSPGWFRFQIGKRPTIETWLFRGGFSYPDANSFPNKFKRFLFRRLVNSGVLAKIHCDDELLFDYANEINQSKKTEIALTPNPVLVRESVPSERNSVKTISCIGMIDQRKGVHLLLNAFSKLVVKTATPVRLLLVGPHDEAIRRKLSSPEFSGFVEKGTIISEDRFVVEEELYNVSAQSDLMVAAYPNHSGRSSVVLWAAALGKPVVGTNRGCIGHVIENQNLGWICNVKDIDEFTETLKSALDADWTIKDIQRVKKYAKFHSIENYQKLASKYIKQRIEVESMR